MVFWLFFCLIKLSSFCSTNLSWIIHTPVNSEYSCWFIFNKLNTCWINSIFTVYCFWRNLPNLNTYFMCIPFCNINESFNWIFKQNVIYFFATLYVLWILIHNSFALKIYTFNKFNFLFSVLYFLMIISIAIHFFRFYTLKTQPSIHGTWYECWLYKNWGATHFYILFYSTDNCVLCSRYNFIDDQSSIEWVTDWSLKFSINNW